MTDQTTNQAAPAPAATPQATPAGEAAPQATQTPQEDNQVPTSWDEIFKHKRFKDLNTRAQNAETRLREIEESRQAEESRKLQEQGNFQKLYEDLQTQYENEKRYNMKLRLASSKDFPADLVDRVTGNTEEEIASDMDRLLAYMTKKDAPHGVTPPPRGGSSTNFDFANATPAQIREYLEKQKNT